ncbi:unnamed protein product [Acanthoscelides obtectus]|uniref:Uncharacterized protein n=1 Tax=Acanthoscelides obtectus TaxID=200917 RepID=A0A9P0Q940_ACAOB|nr:unnamed protein product [Acanthoscelides obtectus]CAK1629810.1 hypothetical protein AOBTE_LOCUS5970 [Acanthoscelides obtectus]
MEVDEDTPGFLSIVATEATEIETIKEHTAEESGDGEEKPVQSVEVVEPAVIADTVLTELKPVYENTCYTVSDLDKGFLKSEVYADLSGSEDSCDRLEVVFETNIGNTAQIDPLEVSVRSSEIAKSQPEEESLNRAFIDVKESKVYQDLSSDSDNIEGDFDESRTQFDELEDCIFQSRSEREDDLLLRELEKQSMM